ncbi:MAG: alpha-2-macroglobulin [Bacteroidetes bacterium]|nr:MAG: alpha-2-macroglobulin [Bacteroidota bacterium]
MKFTWLRLYYTVAFIFFYHIAFAQTPKNYESLWKKVDSLAQKGLNKSALSATNKIYDQAKKDKNDVQLMKALIFQMHLNIGLEENWDINNLKRIEKEIATASEPAKSILESLAAENYWNYFQSNRYRLYNRTQTNNFVKDDIATWGIADFHKRISALYLASIKEDKLLQQTGLEKYDPLILKGNARSLRPTLYDILAHRALDYFENDERDVIRPAYQFQIRENAALQPAADFVNFKFKSQDSTSLLFQAILIHQKLLRFHLDDKKPDALVDEDLLRLQFVKQYSVISEKDSAYRMALNHIISIYENDSVSAEVRYEYADSYAQEILNNESEVPPSKAGYLKIAKSICDETISKFPKTRGAIQCQNLLNQILQTKVSTTVELVNLPNEPFRALVKYKNISKVFLRLIKYDRQLEGEIGSTYQDSYWKKLIQIPSLKSWEQSIPRTEDYLSHSVEIKVDALPVGEYALISGDRPNFSDSNAVLSQVNFYVSGISIVGKGNEYFLLDRKEGNPLAGAEVQIWEETYDYNKSQNKLIKAEKIKSDLKGYFKIKGAQINSRSVRFEINYKGDHLFLHSESENVLAEAYQRGIIEPAAYKNRLAIFTDRSIYRPGQTIFLKAIGMIEDSANKSRLMKAGESIKIFLMNPNYVAVDSITLKFNEYGSVNGKFQAPSNQLSGTYQLLAKNYSQGNTSFSIEEYKRPKFYVELDQPTNSFRLNDSIKLNGTAKAYAGNNITGAKVEYRVTRTVRFSPWFGYFQKRFPRNDQMEIANGATTTDENGKFKIPFIAVPDLSADKTNDPQFNYEIHVTVTDLNGESREGSSNVTVGYKSIEFDQITNTQPIDVDSLKTIPIIARNLAGIPVSIKASIKIYQLKSPGRLIRTRYWSEPDQFIYTEQEFIKYFPIDEYKNESDYHAWEKGSMVFSDTITTNSSSSIKIPLGALKSGKYLIESFAKDENGEDIKTSNYFEVYNSKETTLSSPVYLTRRVIKGTVEPGETAKWQFGTSAQNIYLIKESNRTPIDSSNRFSIEKLNQSIQQESIPVYEKDRGGFGIQIFFVKDNRFFSAIWNVDVPWTNKELLVSLATNRDKMEPGSKEKWKLKIVGYKKEKVAAEILSSMYDASLDQFQIHNWDKPNLSLFNYLERYWESTQGFSSSNPFDKETPYNSIDIIGKMYDYLDLYPLRNYPIYEELQATKIASEDLIVKRANSIPSLAYSLPTLKKAEAEVLADTAELPNKVAEQKNIQSVIRKDFNETAFFFPDLRTDSSGDVEFSFTMPEALTTWKFQALAHTKDLAFGYLQKSVITQKQLMVQPNPPRFLREGDKIDISTKIANLSAKEITGNATLQLLDPETNQPVDGWFQNIFPVQYFTVASNQSSAINFNITVPYNYNKPVLYRIIAKAGDYSDGEENVLPVLANRTLVTESFPLNMNGKTQKEFKFEKLLQNNSETLHSQSLTVEFSSNPAWYVVQALPYLMEYPYECAEQSFNRYYANAIATKIANSAPRVKEIFESWKNSDTNAFLSNLQKNEELKSVLVEETPWVMDAQNESAQKKNIGLLFDMFRMSKELQSNFKKVSDMQSPNGGFVWFKGGPDDLYITQYIMSGIGHLQNLKAIPQDQTKEWNVVINKGMQYLDSKIKSNYDALVKSKVDLKQNHLSNYEVQYLYMRSFFKDKPVPSGSATAFNYYLSQAKKYWLKQSKYMQGMIALALNRNGDSKTASAIMVSLQENSITNEELGMYWKENRGGYYWYEAPIETQALLIEAFSEIGSNTKSVSAMKLWLLKQKQTQNWGTTKASAEACYAFLMKGNDWIQSSPIVEINLGNQKIQSPQNVEAGTGYIKTTIPGADVKNEMGNIRVAVTTNSKDSSTPSWGAVYWQYFENLDQIAPSNSPIQIRKKLFLQKNSDRGPVLEPINDDEELKPGDKIIVRIELQADRDMEYVHLKDMRASGTEPLNVLSGYKWQGGLGYYETTRDASTHFFFNWINKGTYVFEYPLFVAQAGTFSVGIATIQCMYAPEFTSHSEGLKIRVRN